MGKSDSEPDGFREYVTGRQSALLATAYVLTGSRPAAEDLVQTALAKVWPHWTRITAGGDPDAYVRKTLLNSFLSLRGRRKYDEVPLDGTTWPVQSEDLPARSALAQVVDRSVVVQLVGRLPRRQRAVVVLRYFSDLSEAEIATALGCSPGTVKSHHAKALATLRRHHAELSPELPHDLMTRANPASEDAHAEA